VVQITMDQLRADLLERYAPAFTGGLRRLQTEGYWIRHGRVDHALTVSFPGHATLATGMHPSHHGLTANEWWVNRDGKWQEIDVSDDSAYRIVGAGAERIGASPKNLQAETLGEWIKRSSGDAKSIALGTGTSIPIAYAGHRCDGAYWFDSRLNQFTTSTFYADALPEWIVAFNQSELPEYEKHAWELTVPAKFQGLSQTVASSYNHKAARFPHRYSEESNVEGRSITPARWFAGTPLKDEALFALASGAVDAERLGQRQATDYLAIDVDATDSVGHEYGPRSLEQLDTLLRLDRALGAFLQHLDTVVGAGNYVLALSADHGVADPAEDVPGGRWVKTEDVESVLDGVEQIAQQPAASTADLRAAIVKRLKAAWFIADAYTEEQLDHPGSDPYTQLYARSFRPGFTPNFPLWSDKPRPFHPARYGIVVRFRNNMTLHAATGVHGSPYDYDRDVPIIFFGRGIRRGDRSAGGRTVDVAPTLAYAAAIRVPSGLDGHALTFVYDTSTMHKRR
jgi:arylsulfatase A-like enzyme